MEKPIVDKKLLLEKFHGKGGWTYTRVPVDKMEKKHNLGWIKVKGFIDDYEIKKYNLMPSKDGRLFLPISAAIRKAIKKQEGDHVRVVLFIDKDPVEIPEQFMLCLLDEPDALQFFNDLSETDRQNYINWINEAKKQETKVERMAISIEKLLLKKKFYEKFVKN